MSFKKAFCSLTFQPHQPFPLSVVQLSCYFKLPPTLPTMTNLLNPPLSNLNFRQKNFRVHQAVHYIVSPIPNPEFRFVLEFLDQRE